MSSKRIVSMLLLTVMILSTAAVSGCGKRATQGIFMYKLNSANLLFEETGNTYSQYMKKNKKVPAADESIYLCADEVDAAYYQECLVETEGGNYAFIDDNSKWIEWNVNIAETAFYIFSVDYKTVKSNTEDILLNIQVNGENLYDEMRNFTLYRKWKDGIISEDFDKDERGNDIRPIKIEEFTDLSSIFYDEKGYYSDGYGIVLEQGTHTIRLNSVNSGVLIKSLNLLAGTKLPTYNEYYTSIEGRTANVNEDVVIEAERPLYTNTSSVYAVSDWISAATTPNSPRYTLLNAFGDVNWMVNGQRITWEFELENSGYYYIATRARQDYSEGMNAYRCLYIDGKIPCEEAKSVKFPYDFDWKTTVVGEEEPYYFWLDKGIHTLSFEVNTSAISSILIDLDKLINDLNLIYRKIIIITGTTVDIYQDYDLEIKIPELIDSFKYCCNRMRLISNKINKSNNTNGSIASVLDETAGLLDLFIEHPYQVSGKLDSYKTGVDDISSLLTNMSAQSLLLDKIYVVSKGQDEPDNNVSFFQRMKFSLLKFITSYTTDAKAGNDNKSIKVWVNTGRDQAQIIKQMISNSYKEDDNTKINLSIVDTGNTLIQAALAGRGPDVALSLPMNTPVNLAMRGGLVDLSDKIDSIYDEFYESAWTQLRYEDGIYGIPETQLFNMLFIRDDIFAEIGLSGAPQTWNEFYKYMEVIQNNNLMVGVLETDSANIAVSNAISTFAAMYFQKGGTFFNNDCSKTTFDSTLAIDTMNEVVELYTRYGLDKSYSFFNRFRSGELVMALSPYSSYNQLVVAAPEINGMWSMHPIPATVKESGGKSNLESSSGTASIVLNAAKKNDVEDEAIRFVLWWCGADAQAEFAERSEGAMGVAARYTPANKNAFKAIKWSKKEALAIETQWKQIYNVREIPGNYYIERSLTSAIRNTINGRNSIRYNMAKYTNDINLEIARKRNEFGLE